MMTTHLRNRAGFTLIELMIVVAVIGILTTIGIGFYTSMQQSARVAKAQADSRAIATAVTGYLAHTGVLPPSLAALTVTVTNPMGQTGGPFLANVPTAPSGGSPSWTTYTYSSNPTAGTFSITASGDGTTITLP
jgi:prepilin-type N-terminal cleavage/methylation domain-containing protein